MLGLKSATGEEIHPTYDIRLSPRDDWDGKALEPGETYRLEVAVYVSPDLPDGLFEGILEISAAPKGQAPTLIPYRIQLTLAR